MDANALSSLALSNHSTDVFSVTVLPSFGHDGLTVASFSNGKTKDGCLVLEEEFNQHDNPANIVPKQTELWISTICSAGIIPLLFLVGVPGNILSAVVFYKQGLREGINLCVFCLALADLVVVTVTFFLSAEQVYRDYVGPSSFFIKYFVGLTGFTWVSMFLSAVVAAERCFCVVSPLRAQRMLSTRTLAVVITSISLLLLTGMLVIAGPKHTEACVFNPLTNTTSLIVYVTDYYKENKEILDLFDVFLYATALPAIFLLIIIVTTTVTAAKLSSALRWRQRSSSASGVLPTGSSENHKVALTRMLIAISVLFVVCLSPMLIVQITMFLVPELKYGGHFHNLTAVLWTIISVFRCVNSSLNFFVYYRMGSRFRQTLKQLLMCGRMKKNMPESRSSARRQSLTNSEGGRQRIYSVTGIENTGFN